MKLTRSQQHSVVAVPTYGARWLLALAWLRIARRSAVQLRFEQRTLSALGRAHESSILRELEQESRPEVTE